MRHSSLVRIIVMVPLVLCVMASSAFAQKTFNQAKAVKGGVTPGDEPGFPVTISRAGTYKLVGNLTVTDKDTTAVWIRANNVTLDLNGFGIFGPGESGSGYGIIADETNTIVTNGTVRGMGANGLQLNGGLHRVERIQAMENEIGIWVGQNSLVIGCTVGWNRGTGIQTNQSSVVRDSTAVSNGFIGIRVAGGSTVLGNTSRSNAHYGLWALDGVGYAQNVFQNNGAGSVAGGVQMGGNVCGTGPCP